MNMLVRRIVLSAAVALGLVTAAQAFAAPDAEVEGLQAPAWLTRDGKKMPLAVGAQLKNGDTITTGDGSRVLLRLAEGSAVKLGENARFELNDMSQKRDGAQQRFTASLGVREGAFRFTTAPDAKSSLRNVDVKFPTVTASITGTDLWGKSAGDREIVALVEGRITTTRRGDPPVVMDEPRSVYIAEKDARPAPITKITLAQLQGFAQETEMQAGAGVTGRGGAWKVYAASAANEEEAGAVLDRLRNAGFAATVQPAVSQGKQVYQVRIAGLVSEADGIAVAIKLRVQLGIQDVRVSL